MTEQLYSSILRGAGTVLSLLEVAEGRVLVGPQESSALSAYLRRLPPAAFSATHW